MLEQKYAIDTFTLVPRADWAPYPTIDRRKAWAGLPASVREAYLAQGESLLNQD